MTKLLPTGRVLGDGTTKLLPTGRIYQSDVKLLPSGQEFTEDLFIVGTLQDVSLGQNLAFAIDDTNTIIYRGDALTTNPANGDKYVVWYRASDAQICVAKQAGGVGAFVTTVGTATIIAVTDDHLMISAGVDNTGRLIVAFGFHSDQMNIWRAPNPGDTLITDATKLVSPVGAGPGPGTGLVSGNAAFEAAATYPFFKSYTDGDIAYLWRQGGSGNGNQALYNISGTTITSVSLDFLNGVVDDCSYYLNEPVIEGAASAHPNRLWLSFQVRDSIDPLSARDLWCIYSDDRGVTWHSWTGALMSLPMNQSNLGPALVANIPAGTINYDGLQGMGVGNDGIPCVVLRYGDIGVDMQIHAYKQAGSVWTIKQISNFNQATLQYCTRPMCVSYNDQLITFYGYVENQIGSLKYIVATGETLADPIEHEVVFANGVNIVGASSPLYDSRFWEGGSGTLEMFVMASSIQGVTPTPAPEPNGPYKMTAALEYVSPPAIQTPLQVFGSMPFWFDPAVGFTGSAWSDQSGNGRNAAQANAANQFTLEPTGGPNNTPVLSSDGNDFMTFPFLRAAPGTTPYYWWAVISQITYVNNRTWYNDGGMAFFQNPSGSTLRILNGAGGGLGNGNAPVGTNVFRFVEFQLTNSVNDYLAIGDTYITGVNCNNNVGLGTVTIGGTAGGGSNARLKTGEWGAHSGLATFEQRGKLKRYLANKYGKSIFMG